MATAADRRRLFTVTVSTETALKNAVAIANSDTARRYRIEVVADVQLTGKWPDMDKTGISISPYAKVTIVGAKPGSGCFPSRDSTS